MSDERVSGRIPGIGVSKTHNWRKLLQQTPIALSADQLATLAGDGPGEPASDGEVLAFAVCSYLEGESRAHSHFRRLPRAVQVAWYRTAQGVRAKNWGERRETPHKWPDSDDFRGWEELAAVAHEGFLVYLGKQDDHPPYTDLAPAERDAWIKGVRALAAFPQSDEERSVAKVDRLRMVFEDAGLHEMITGHDVVDLLLDALHGTMLDVSVGVDRPTLATRLLRRVLKLTLQRWPESTMGCNAVMLRDAEPALRCLLAVDHKGPHHFEQAENVDGGDR